MMCRDIEVQPVLQDTSGEDLNRGSNKAQDAKLDIHARSFWERHRSAFFDVRVCHPNAVSYKDLERQQIYRIHENEKKRLYSRRVLDIEHGTFTPLVFTTTGGMGKECLMYHSRLAQLIAIKKGEQYAKPSHGSADTRRRMHVKTQLREILITSRIYLIRVQIFTPIL